MKRHVSITAIALAAGLVLTGCSNTNPDQQTVSKLALKEATKHQVGTDKEAVAGSWEWQNGWSVLVREDGKNSDGPYVNWWAYGFEPDGDGWKRSRYELVEPSTTPEKTPHKATCLTLAQTDSEVHSCDDLSD
ncbi:hypothetical protein [Curtobacterium poinsettiae]|uniref:hypothetical protein n=1 Tax=Curtobacterium poinsettiae TaxID=159612 RepID=UPI001BDE6324|nr:hypothetical protein [Curtobacterium flaccumfaciens]MBT1611888.1 hypothetical protein [Curtobacterium flaccumfaciens pv. poinsettiae]